MCELSYFEPLSPVLQPFDYISMKILLQGLVGIGRGISFLASGFDNSFMRRHT